MPVSDILDRHFPEGTLDFLRKDIALPCTADDLHKARKEGEDRIIALSTGILDACKDAGLCAPCPNNGPRDVREMSAWNAWLDGNLDKWSTHFLQRAPAFNAIRRALIEETVRVSMQKEREASPDGKINLSDRIDVQLVSAEVDGILRAAEARVREWMTSPGLDPFLDRTDMQCNLTSRMVMAGGAPLAPVLVSYDPAARAFMPLPELETPKIARHLELDLPSQQIVIADWFRIRGFKEGVEALLPQDDHYEINGAEGLDQRARDYYEQLGMIIVQVGNCSPSGYEDPAGVLRMGYVDEDADAFWPDPDNQEAAIGCPEERFSTCTDLWANTFADPERIVDILMASGMHEDRGAAREALDTYIAETYGAHLVDLGVNRVHVYMPTGYAVHKDAFPETFRVPEMDYPEWREDMYLISRVELSPEPDLIAEEDWIQVPWGDPDNEPEFSTC